jgi:hypothetical protein
MLPPGLGCDERTLGPQSRLLRGSPQVAAGHGGCESSRTVLSKPTLGAPTGTDGWQCMVGGALTKLLHATGLWGGASRSVWLVSPIASCMPPSRPVASSTQRAQYRAPSVDWIVPDAGPQNKFRSKSVRSAISRICTRGWRKPGGQTSLPCPPRALGGMGLPLLACVEGARRLQVRACSRWAVVHWKTAEGSSGLSFGSCICRKDAFDGKKQRAVLDSAVQDRDQRSGHSLRAALDDEQHIERSP